MTATPTDCWSEELFCEVDTQLNYTPQRADESITPIGAMFLNNTFPLSMHNLSTIVPCIRNIPVGDAHLAKTLRKILSHLFRRSSKVSRSLRPITAVL